MDEPQPITDRNVDLTYEQLMLVDIIREGDRLSITRLNDANSRFVTLATAMAGGSLVALKNDMSTGWGRALAASMFFLALAFSVAGSVPFKSNVPLQFPAIELEFERVVRWKRQALFMSFGLLLMGIFFAIAGTTVRAIYPLPTP